MYCCDSIHLVLFAVLPEQCVGDGHSPAESTGSSVHWEMGRKGTWRDSLRAKTSLNTGTVWSDAQNLQEVCVQSLPHWGDFGAESHTQPKLVLGTAAHEMRRGYPIGSLPTCCSKGPPRILTRSMVSPIGVQMLFSKRYCRFLTGISKLFQHPQLPTERRAGCCATPNHLCLLQP